MVSSFRLVFLCITTTPLRAFSGLSVLRKTATKQSLFPVTTFHRFPATSKSEVLTRIARASASCRNLHHHCRGQTTGRQMTSDADNNVGPTDIDRKSVGEEADDVQSPSQENSLTSWRALLEASSGKSRKIRGSNYVQLATVDPAANEPRCRCVVFRGFVKLSAENVLSNTCDDFPCIMKMITDQRSEKIEQVLAHPNGAAELLWWFPKTSEQYRISGRLIFVGGGKHEYDHDKELMTARKEQWGNLSDSAREPFLAREVPGVSYSGESEVATGGRDAEGKVLPPPDTFLLMLLIPKHCDYLRLTNMYRQKDKISPDGQWATLRVNP